MQQTRRIKQGGDLVEGLLHVEQDVDRPPRIACVRAGFGRLRDRDSTGPERQPCLYKPPSPVIFRSEGPKSAIRREVNPGIADSIVQAAMQLLFDRHFADPTDKQVGDL